MGNSDVAGSLPRTGERLDRSSGAEIDLATILVWLRRCIGLIALLAVIGAGAGLAFGTFATPRYTASVDLLIDPGNLQVVADEVLPQAQQSDAQLLEVESKLRILTARATLADVVAALHLDSDEEFAPTSTSGLAGFLGGSAKVPEDPATTALRALVQRVSATREERSYVVTLSVWTASPQKSGDIANAIVKAFKAELVKSDSDAVGQAASALGDRLVALKQAATDSAAKVEAFKKAHNLVVNAGQLTSTISASQLNTQLLDAKAKLNDAEAHYQQLTTGGAAAANASALDSPTLTALRAQSSTLQQQVDSLSLTLGPRHPTLISLRSQLAAARRQIDDETARMVQAAKQQVDQAQAGLTTLNKQMVTANDTVFTDNAAQVELSQLQSDAQAQATIYQSFLTRAQSAVQRQQIDATNVRVISPPIAPDSRSYPPRTVLLVGAGSVAGAGLGGAIAIGLGWLRRNRRRERNFGRA